MIRLHLKLSKIDATLRRIGVSPVKTLGQNFLHDKNLARWIVEQAKPTSQDYVLEIGPGLGALTELVLDTGARMLAIEKDGRLARFLRNNFKDQQLEVQHADALKFDARILYTERQVKLLANLPYYAASELVLKFVTNPSPISLSVLMLQKEMAKRLSAVPSTKDYGTLTLYVQLHHQVEYLRTIPKTVFLPRPAVDSALIRIKPRDPFELPQCDYELFAKLTRRGFSQRRKQLRNLLRDTLPAWESVASALGLKPNARAEELSLEQWIALVNQIAPPGPAPSAQSPEECFPVVDAADRVQGNAPRGQVHGNNLLHRAVHILIFSEAGEVYLQKRSRWKDRHPLLWDSSAAGHVSTGEDYDSAAKRELREELGIDVALEKVVKLPASQRTDHEFIWLYRARHNGPFTPNRNEIEYGSLFPPAMVAQWIRARPESFAPGFKECWKAYAARY